ncbi:hypothetical protein K491DRAFT_610946 [Lophiostoma macrostomum CBS 122681]|uniref:Zn(2)-C6 fungal-type domain-containing protein n=1 Tax=Lophiostoma macrostomum CBS 122681 TaxID=1314788 RepID=A0A6A6SQV1_9PLEO|nr:hypothetical protein K491DRAFT_610946 [Lophiostoma macrostomum CBS 122681]
MRYDSCRQCIKRRIRCDQQDPRCGKCIKKGIQCSGVGKQFRFVLQTPSLPIARSKRRDLSTRTPASTHGCVPHTVFMGGCEDCSTLISTLHQQRSPVTTTDVNCDEGTQSDGPIEEIVRSSVDHTLASPIEHLNPGVRMFFDYFSRVVAPYMVVYDGPTNGYRNIVLPLASQDDLVQRAVCVVAAMHLSRKRPDLVRPAWQGRAAILSRLRKDSISGQEHRIFSPSTWTTIILLLVGETITGSMDYALLFGILASYVEHDGACSSKSDSTAEFLGQQTQMFQLFTPPLIDIGNATKFPSTDLDQHCSWIIPADPRSLPQMETCGLLKEAICTAMQICVIRLTDDIQPFALQSLVDRLLDLVFGITHQTPGAHAFVWVYYIGACHSIRSSQRAFFHCRLTGMYQIAEFGNIIAAVGDLTNIWNTSKMDALEVRAPLRASSVLII